MNTPSYDSPPPRKTELVSLALVPGAQSSIRDSFRAALSPPQLVSRTELRTWTSASRQKANLDRITGRFGALGNSLQRVSDLASRASDIVVTRAAVVIRVMCETDVVRFTPYSVAGEQKVMVSAGAPIFSARTKIMYTIVGHISVRAA